MPDEAPATVPGRPVTPVSVATLDAILDRHGLRGRRVVPLSGTSAGSSVYLLGDDRVLRVPHQQPGSVQGLETACIAIPAARAAGVRTPRILVLDERRDLVPVPYAILERVPGEPYSRHGWAIAAAAAIWRELGHDLALLHAGVGRSGPAGGLPANDTFDDPRPWLDGLVTDGLIGPQDAAWLRRVIDDLAPLACTPEPRTFCHGDVNADNILIDPPARQYLALIDWDGAGWMDPAWDFVPVPLRAVPFMLEGYRQVGRVPGDETAEARILWHHVQYRLFILTHTPPRERARAGTMLQRLRAGMRDLLQLPGARWMRYLL